MELLMSNKERWQADAEKLGGKTLVAVITEILATNHSILSRLDAADRRHEELLLKAFPGGDVEGHNRYHEELIASVAAKNKLIAAIAEKTIGGLVLALVFGVISLIWQGALKAIMQSKGLGG